MRHNIITTENYLLVVDDSEININQYVYCDLGYIEKVMDIINGWVYHTKMLGKNPIKHYKKIIAHLPLNNSPILEGVDLLPPIEDEAEKLAEIEWKSSEDRTWKAPYIYAFGFTEGYNKAKAKYKYTEEDIRNAIVKGFLMGMDREHDITEVVEQIMLSLQQPKMPVGFECEDEVYMYSINGDIMKPKTTTNSQGLTQWVGEYIY